MLGMQFPPTPRIDAYFLQQPLLSKTATAAQVQRHPNSIRLWRQRWGKGLVRTRCLRVCKHALVLDRVGFRVKKNCPTG
jgi:hypothetical protein